ncbi:MAG TPA: class I SAM-dependent methyltransferase [Myxococcota bacterium]|jgi:demethylmenaquinone methyltransferase/2-methoxy-6-polyprenyl-1,4-benzoquinol methylase|nr:class I SAM-dependent methyltransferase [Myxococcota bacterium]
MTTTPQTQPPLPPHAPLRSYYETDANRARYVNELFDRTAPHYNTVEALFGNVGLYYRRLCLRRAGLAPGMHVLDVAIGTAAVARNAARIVGPTGRVVGVDPSRGMLNEARKVFKGPVARGVAQALPIASGRFDFVTMGIALRHVPDLLAAFREYRRVLKPGGRVWILEGHIPESPVGRRVTRWAWSSVVPNLTLLLTGSRDAKLLMDYYWDTVDKCVPPEQILQAMRDAGFEDVRFKATVPGMVCEYTGRNPERAG